jgi:hypothetical protein
MVGLREESVLYAFIIFFYCNMVSFVALTGCLAVCIEGQLLVANVGYTTTLYMRIFTRHSKNVIFIAVKDG